MDRVLACGEAYTVFTLPADRIGDLVVTCMARKAPGTVKEEHDPRPLTCRCARIELLPRRLFPLSCTAPVDMDTGQSRFCNQGASLAPAAALPWINVIVALFQRVGERPIL